MSGIRGESLELRSKPEAPDAGALCDKVYTLKGLDDSVNRRTWKTGAFREVAQRKVFAGVADRTQDIDRADHGLHSLRSGCCALGCFVCYFIHLASQNPYTT